MCNTADFGTKASAKTIIGRKRLNVSIRKLSDIID